MVWISNLMVTHGAAPLPPTFITIMASLFGSPLVLGIWYVMIKIVTSCLDHLSRIRLSGPAEPTLHLPPGTSPFMILP
jgi:hypothetical protein